MKILEVDKEYYKNNDLPEWCNKECYAIKLEDETIFLVSEEIYFKYYLYDKEELSQEEYLKYELAFKVECCKQSAASFLFYNRFTTFEVRKKLEKHGHSDESISAVIEYYEKLGYLDDRKYADLYIKKVISSKIMSLKDMTHRLEMKGISAELVYELAELNDFCDADMAQKALDKKTHNMTKEDIASLDYKEKMRFMRFLSNKGFSGETILALFR